MCSGYRRSDSFNIMLFFELCSKVFYMYVIVKVYGEYIIYPILILKQIGKSFLILVLSVILREFSSLE